MILEIRLGDLFLPFPSLHYSGQKKIASIKVYLHHFIICFYSQQTSVFLQQSLVSFLFICLIVRYPRILFYLKIPQLSPFEMKR